MKLDLQLQRLSLLRLKKGSNPGDMQENAVNLQLRRIEMQLEQLTSKTK